MDKKKGEERRMRVQKQREILRSSAGGVPHISDLRIVLLGARGEGRSSLGNTILHHGTMFDTSALTLQCVKREHTAERHITVVEAPGWRKSQPLAATPDRIKQGIVQSVSLCPPGPHGLLLVIDMRLSFTEAHRRVVQEHLELLGERVWNHTIALFTFGHWLDAREITIEELIESAGEALQWVVEKCGNRYHVVENSELYRYGDPVPELLEKIEEMVVGNSGNHFDLLNKREEREQSTSF